MADAIDAATYTMLRMYIETGHVRYQRWAETGVWPEMDPPTSTMISVLLGYITPDLLPLTPAESATLMAAGGEKLPPELRRGDVVFRDRKTLVAAVNALAPELAGQVHATAPGADDGDVEWWAVALSAAGALRWIGKLSWQGALISTIASYLLLGIVAYFGLSAKTPEGKNIVLGALGDVAQGAKNTFQAVGQNLELGWYVLLGSAAFVAIAGGLYFIRSRADAARLPAPPVRGALPPLDVIETPA